MTYGEHARLYLTTGLGLPVPLAGKDLIATGVTGGKAPMDSSVVASLARKFPTANVGLRPVSELVGIDVDDYTKPDGTVKRGASTLREWEHQIGRSLPPTIRSTSRGADNPSGIRWFRVLPGESDRFRGSLGPDIEIVRNGHRYATVWPSTHPDTGAQYEWLDDAGNVMDALPELSMIPDLPQEAVDALTRPIYSASNAAAPVGLDELLAAAPEGDPCERTRRYAAKVAGLDHVGHSNGPSVLFEGVRLVLERHPGMTDVFLSTLDACRDYLSADRPERQPAEFRELVEASVRNAQLKPVEQSCTCGEHPSELSDDDAPDRTAPQQIPETGLPDDPAFEGLSKAASQRAESLIADEQAKEAIRRWHHPIPPMRSRLITLDQLDDMPTVEPLVEGVLGLGEIAMLVGDSNLGKTAFAVGLGLAIAEGSQVHDRATRQTRTLYCSGEGQRGLRNRIRAAQERWHYTPASDAFQLHPDTVDLSDSTSAEQLAELTNKEGFGLVILDTLAATMGDFVENDATAMGLYLRRARALVERVDGTVLILHHTNKGEGKMRGSSALRGRADTVLTMTGNSGRWALSHDKRRDGGTGSIGIFRTVPFASSVVVEEHRPFDYPSRTEELHLADPPQPTHPGSGGPGDLVEKLFDQLASEGDGLVDPSRWMAECRAAGVATSTAHDRKRALLRQGRLVERKHRGEPRLKRAS